MLSLELSSITELQEQTPWLWLDEMLHFQASSTTLAALTP